MQKRVIIKQQDQKDCGPCCLLSFIKYYGGYVPLEKIRIDCNTSSMGTSAFHMIEGLKSYGFDAWDSLSGNFSRPFTSSPLKLITARS